jgi:hypothetical protein
MICIFNELNVKKGQLYIKDINRKKTRLRKLALFEFKGLFQGLLQSDDF